MWNIASVSRRTVLVVDLILQLDQSRTWGKLLKESQWQFTCQKLCWIWTWHQHKAAIHLIQLPRYSHLKSGVSKCFCNPHFVIWGHREGSNILVEIKALNNVECRLCCALPQERILHLLLSRWTEKWDIPSSFRVCLFLSIDNPEVHSLFNEEDVKTF